MATTADLLPGTARPLLILKAVSHDEPLHGYGNPAAHRTNLRQRAADIDSSGLSIPAVPPRASGLHPADGGDENGARPSTTR